VKIARNFSHMEVVQAVKWNKLARPRGPADVARLPKPPGRNYGDLKRKPQSPNLLRDLRL
jgi:hypothetical protein